jgi:hypothetical protein
MNAMNILPGAALVATLIAMAGGSAAAPRTDEFSAVRCGEDVVKALTGKAVVDGRVVEIEAAHRDIGLKNLGGSDVNDTLFQIGWSICGDEYQLLETRGKVSDAIRFPNHSRRQPGFLGACAANGKAVDGVLAVLDNPSPRSPGEPPYEPGDTTMLDGMTAWRIDMARARFVALPVDGLRCPRGGIFTVDGGR